MGDDVRGKYATSFRRVVVMATFTVVLASGPWVLWSPGAVQDLQGPDEAPVQSARALAPVDLTGYWVSIVTEDWIERMAPDSPPSGTGGNRGEPVTPDPNQPCRAYGAGGSMRVPGRLHISWSDDDTLQVDMDAGTQTRMFHFDPSAQPVARPSLQGYSVAKWSATAGSGRGGRRGQTAAPPAWASLHVVTTNMTDGYLLTSRSLYSANAVLTEEFMPHSDFGEDYFTVRAILEDNGSTNTTSSTFRREPDSSRFSPTGCDIVR